MLFGNKQFMRIFDFKAENRYINYKDSIWISKTLDPNLKIARYITLAQFIDILGGQYLFSKRDSFTDRHEKGEFINLAYHFWHFNEYHQQTSPEVLNEWTHQDCLAKYATQLPCTCWTEENDENFLMWKAYGSYQIGILIESSISDFIESLSLDKKMMVVSKMKYSKERALSGLDDWLFYKPISYRNEKEIRFYLIDSSNNGTESDILLSSIKMERAIPIFTNKFIHRIVLSPFIKRSLANTIKVWLETMPGIKQQIELSSILEF